MPTKRAVIVLEFNELSPVLMRRFIDAGHLPMLARPVELVDWLERSWREVEAGSAPSR